MGFLSLNDESEMPVYPGKRIVIQTFPTSDASNPEKRILHRPAGGETGYRLERGRETVITEVHMNGTIVHLYMSAICEPDLWFNTYSKRNYQESVSRLMIECPVHPSWLFHWISCFQNLESVRIGRGFYGESVEIPVLGTIPHSPNVHEVVVEFCKEDFDRLKPTTRRAAIIQLNLFLDLTASHLTGLDRVNMNLPDMETLDRFWLKAPKMRRHVHGTHSVTHETGVVRFMISPPKENPSKEFHDEPQAKIQRIEPVEKYSLGPLYIDLAESDDDIRSMPTPHVEACQNATEVEDTDLQDDKKWSGGFPFFS